MLGGDLTSLAGLLHFVGPVVFFLCLTGSLGAISPWMGAL
jgi:hypothetical protein